MCPVTLITGIDRSGTSMIARLLNLCGLYLGHDDEIIPPKPHNPRGMWENYLFQMISKFVLKRFGQDAGGDLPFLAQDGWENDPKLHSTYCWARRLVQAMNDSSDNWGWKSPTASFLLPFWHRLIPDLKVVLCLRHPMDVAASLLNKDLEQEKALWLWYVYMNEARENARDCIVVRYDAFFEWLQGEDELERLCRFCELEMSSDALGEVQYGLRHHRTHGTDMLPEKVAKLYGELLEEAGDETRT